MLVAAAGFVSLGRWQLDRAEVNRAIAESFAEAPDLPVLERPPEAGAEDDVRFRLIRLSGRYLPATQILLDNMTHEGRAGYAVLTPFETTSGQIVLVNRGFVPADADRRVLPEVPTDGAPRAISGRLNRLQSTGPRLGSADVLRPDSWPQLVTWLDHDPIERALGADLETWLVQLDAAQPDGFAGRDWKPATMPPATHGAYALQWFSLAAAAVIIWLLLGLRRGKATRRENETIDGDAR